MMRTIFASALVALLLSACTLAQTPTINNRPLTEANCKVPGMTWVSKYATNYSATAGVTTGICIFDAYEEACPTLSGVTTCDTTVSNCIQWKGTNTWKESNTLKAWTATTAPSQCLQYGTLRFHPDPSVLVVIQPLTSMLVFIGLAISVIINFRRDVHWFSLVIVVFMCIIGIIQTVSYYYLNSYIIIASGLIALAAYTRKTPVAIGFGMFILLGAFFWVTFKTGLGSLQHHSRLEAGPSYEDTYEIMCDMYYSGFFSIPRALMKDTDDSQTQFFGYCNRAFLAAQLFLMIVQEYLLILLIAMGAFALTDPKERSRDVSEEEQKQQPEEEEATESF